MSNSNQYTQRRLKDVDGNAILRENGSVCRVQIHKENREVLKVNEDNWTDAAHARYAELFPEGVDIREDKMMRLDNVDLSKVCVGNPDRELEWIATMEKKLAARKKAAKKAKKQREKEKKEQEAAKQQAAFEVALRYYNNKISEVDKKIAEMTANRDALVKEREEFVTTNSEFKVKKTLQRKSPGRQNAKWGQDSLAWIRSRIKDADGSISQVKEYDDFMKAFPRSSRSRKAVIAKISKEKQIWLRRDSHEMARSIGCFTQTYNQLFKKW